MSARRNAVVRRNLVIRTDAIAGTANRVQKRRVESLVDLLPEAADMDVDHIGLRIEMIVPHALEQHGAGHDLASMAHKIFEQAELTGLELYRLLGAAHLAGQ